MRKKWFALFLTGVMAVMATGCGGEYAGRTEGDAVSGGAVSGLAVSGGAVSDPVVSGPAVSEKETDADKYSTDEEYRFCTDTNLYRKLSGKNSDCILQTRLDGSHKKKIKIAEEFSTFICVKDGYLYYETDDIAEKTDGDMTISSSSGSTIWSVPITKDKDGYDVVKMEQKKKILSDEEMDLDQVYMNDRYIFYKANFETSFVKYDRKSKKKLPVDDLSLDGSCEEITGCGDTVVLFADKGAYIHKLSETGWKQVASAGISWESLRAWGKTSLFFSGDVYEIMSDIGMPDYVRRCDLTSGECKEIVSREQLRQAVSEAEGLANTDMLDVCLITDLFYQGDRCYIQVQANWTDGENYRMEYLILSCAEEEDSPELCYEKELTECLRTYGTAQEGKVVDTVSIWEDGEDEVIKEHAIAADSHCYYMTRGKAFFNLFDYKKNRGGVGCFDLAEKKFRWLTEKEAEFYEPCYGTWGDEQEDTLSNYEPPTASLSKRSAVMCYGVSDDLEMEFGKFVRK